MMHNTKCIEASFTINKEVWVDTKIFLCLWHVKRAWQKQSSIKTLDKWICIRILWDLSQIMYDKSRPYGDATMQLATDKLVEFEMIYPHI